MDNKIFRNVITAILVTVMITTSIVMVEIITSDNVNAQERTVKYNTAPNLSYPSKIYVNKAFNVSVYGDTTPTGSAVADGTVAYIPQKFTITKNGAVQKSWDLNGQTSTTITNVTLPEAKTIYYFEVDYNLLTYRIASDSWVSNGSTEKYKVKVSADNASSNQAVINKKITIKFNKNKGQFAKGSIKQKTVTTKEKYGTLAKLKKRKGYTFAGWYTKKNGGTKVTKNSTVNLTGNTTFYAQWKYAVKFNTNKGKVNKKSKKIISGKKYGSLPTPKRSGYTFKGWYTKKKGGTKITKSSYVTKVKKHTLYAQWTKKSSTNSGSNTYPGYITKTKYNKITKTMSYSDVVDLVGGEAYNRVINYDYFNNPIQFTCKWYTPNKKGTVTIVFYYPGQTVKSKTNSLGW